MTLYDWAANKEKLSRAASRARGQGEEGIKAEYIRLGGKVLEVKSKLTDEQLNTDIETLEKAEIVVETKVKRTRKKKNA